MRDDLGSKRFTFAAITDTHLNQGEDDCNSPHDVNLPDNRKTTRLVDLGNGVIAPADADADGNTRLSFGGLNAAAFRRKVLHCKI